MHPPIEQITTDGYDVQFGTNVLGTMTLELTCRPCPPLPTSIGHWYFTELLLPALTAGAKTSPDGYARVVTTSSSGAHLGTIDWDTFKDGPARQKKGSNALYFQSKLVGPQSYVNLMLVAHALFWGSSTPSSPTSRRSATRARIY